MSFRGRTSMGSGGGRSSTSSTGRRTIAAARSTTASELATNAGPPPVRSPSSPAAMVPTGTPPNRGQDVDAHVSCTDHGGANIWSVEFRVVSVHVHATPAMASATNVAARAHDEPTTTPVRTRGVGARGPRDLRSENQETGLKRRPGDLVTALLELVEWHGHRERAHRRVVPLQDHRGQAADAVVEPLDVQRVPPLPCVVASRTWLT